MEEYSHTPDLERRNSLKHFLTPEVLKDLTKKSDVEGFKQLAFHVGCMLFSTFLIYCARQTTSSLFLWSAMTLHGFFLSFLFMGLHECVHRTAFESLWLNDAVAWWYGFLSGRLPKYYLHFHFPHHRHTGDITKDPELMDTLIDPSFTSFPRYLVYLTGIPFWIAKIETAIRLAAGNATEPWVKLPRSKKEIIDEQRYFLAIYAAVFLIDLKLGTGFVWYYWLIPSLLGQPFLRFYLISEHVGCQASDNMLSNTRTTPTYWWYRQLAWNMPWHVEHHAYPSVPFWQLGAINKLIVKEVEKMDGCNPQGQGGYWNLHLQLLKSFAKGA